MKRILSLILCLVLILGISSVISASAYDFEGYISSWAIDEVNTAINLGFVPEFLQDNYYTMAMKRFEFAALAVTFYEKVTGTEVNERMNFNDTADIYVEKAAALGIVNGTGNNNFSPNERLTREQAATILARFASILGKPLSQNQADFKDIDKASAWALDAIGQVQAAGIMNGSGGGLFNPKAQYSKEQGMATIVTLYDYMRRVDIIGANYTDSTPTIGFGQFPQVQVLENVSPLIASGAYVSEHSSQDPHCYIKDEADKNKFICCYDYYDAYTETTAKKYIEKYCEYMQAKGFEAPVVDESPNFQYETHTFFTPDGNYKWQFTIEKSEFEDPHFASYIVHLTILGV